MIPFQLQDVTLDAVVRLMYTCDQLLLGQSSVLNILGRFEKKQYIHLIVNRDHTVLRYSLPRCKLSFEQSLSNVRSREFNGFRLRENQVLGDTLPSVQSYLVLRRIGVNQEKVLIPSGKVVIPTELDASVGYHVYTIHSRLRNLMAAERLGRLHLAGLYASSANYLPGKRTKKPGAVNATTLVRQCFTSEPLNDVEKRKLVEVSSHSNLSCTLRLICAWIRKCSNTLRFLHTDKEMPYVRELELDEKALDEYRRTPYSLRLLQSEEIMVLGTRQVAVDTPPLLLVFATCIKQSSIRNDTCANIIRRRKNVWGRRTELSH